MGIMDNEGHDPLGFGNILRHTDGNDFRRLKAENAQLQARLDLQMPAIEELTKEREMYRMRWLGSMTPEDAALIRAESARLRAALNHIIADAESVDGLASWEAADIARQALESTGEQKLDTK